jgi:uncharacterized protein (UPF0333 family)
LVLIIVIPIVVIIPIIALFYMRSRNIAKRKAAALALRARRMEEDAMQ